MKFKLRRMALPAHASPPARGRGLKYKFPVFLSLIAVAPRTGAWIEIPNTTSWCLLFAVAPRTGAWIEIALSPLPTAQAPVAPRTGAWIEIQAVPF